MHKLKRVCRCCLSTDSGLLPLDTDVDMSANIADCLKIHLNFVISKDDDGLPTSICLECFEKLLLVRRFHLLCLESESYLLRLRSKANHSDVMSAKALARIENERSPKLKGLVDAFDFAPEFKVECTVDSEEIYVEDSTTNSETKVEDAETLISATDVFFEEPTSQPDTGPMEERSEETNDPKVFLNIEVLREESVDLLADDFGSKKGSESDIFLCLQCYKNFETKNELDVHFDTVHGEDNEKGFCIDCAIKFPSKDLLMNHLQTHTYREKRYTCMFCDKVFNQRHKLKSHLRTHTGEKPYACKVCGRAFSQSQDLGTHMMLHTGKPLQCPKCEKRFCRKSILKVHMRVHDNVRPYACELCDKTYRINSHLKTHMLRVHSDVRNFVCHICGAACKEKVALQHHMKTHSRPYRCPKCPLQSGHSHSFRMHLVKRHDIHEHPRNFIQPSTPV